MNYNKIQLFENSDIHFVIGKRGSFTQQDIQYFESLGVNNIIQWDPRTVFLATFTNGIDAGDLAGRGRITEYEILRKDLTDNSFKYIAKINSAYHKIQDYTPRSNSDYEYWIFPIFEDSGYQYRGNPIVTKGIQPKWDGITLCGLLPTPEENVYTIDKKNIWNFSANINTGTFSAELGKNFEDTFGRFSKSSADEKDYLRFNVSAYIGDIINCSEYINDDMYKINRLRSFLKTTDMKLIKDPKGHCIFGDAENFSYTIDNEDPRMPTTISFDFRQMYDEAKLSVYGLEV